MLALMAQHIWPGSGGIVGMAKTIIIIVAVCAVVWIVVKASGLPIPPWVWSILFVILLAVVAIVAIEILASL
jgi:hypothetical protein